uniref:Uncharacterized protein n=1 Tax=Avena sativa TaxID=4498 RepID=A0ACD5V7S4_AVESA
MSGHHDATKPYQPRRGPERPPPEQPAEEQDAAGAAIAEPEPGAMEQYEPHLEHEEEGEEEEEEEEVEEEGEEGIEYGYEYGTGEAVPMDAEAAAAAEHAQHGAMAMAGGVQQPLPHGQLTLSFQGEVFVFENVSAEKVQAVLLLLGGKELPPGSVPGPSSSSSSYSKAMNFSHRMESLIRFRQKRKERNFDKKIRYSVRKEVAHRMQRHKGQFTSSKAKAEEAKSAGVASDGSANWGAVEDRPPSASVCQHCGISSTLTPMMRKGPNGPRTLCNACGLMWANKGFLRDVSKNPHAPLQVVPPATNDAQNGTAEAPIAEQETLALEAPPPDPAPDANGHDGHDS